MGQYPNRGDAMKAFLSHSSADREFVEAVYSALMPDCLWLDRAEIEWGDRFVDEISEGIRKATDFVLFWSASAAASEWVRIETHMAFLRSLESRGDSVQNRPTRRYGGAITSATVSVFAGRCL